MVGMNRNSLGPCSDNQKERYNHSYEQRATAGSDTDDH
jgi:hypothetical protein